jgi:hypothetical protein
MQKSFTSGSEDNIEEQLDDFVGSLEKDQLISISPLVKDNQGVYSISCQYRRKDFKNDISER